MHTELRHIAQVWTPKTLILRVLLLALLWFVLSEGDLRYWGLILMAVLCAAFASLILVPGNGLGWSLGGWIRFVPFFIGQSVLGGVDVALRAISPTPRLDPGYVEFHFRLQHDPARVFVANTMSLMPGTLSVSLDDDRLCIHVLDMGMPAVDRAREVEAHAARMFRLDLSS